LVGRSVPPGRTWLPECLSGRRRALLWRRAPCDGHSE
jgi:hypothetical protein